VLQVPRLHCTFRERSGRCVRVIGARTRVRGNLLFPDALTMELRSGAIGIYRLRIQAGSPWKPLGTSALQSPDSRRQPQQGKSPCDLRNGGRMELQ